MRLSALLDALPPHLAPQRRGSGDDDPIIRGVTYDSRGVSPGDLFVALRGENQDGHEYLAQALDLGAAALLVEAPPEGVEATPEELGSRGPTLVSVPDTRRALAPIARRFYGEPADQLRLIGVTGTNGKTSTTFLIESILEAAGIAVGIIGTVEIRYADHRERTVNTTPESLDLQRTLRAMCTSGVSAAALEVSSHGLSLGRVEGCRFEVGAVTNLTPEHLDFHETMDSYLEAKTLLFRNFLASDASAVVNLDDPRAEAFLDAARQGGARLIRVSRRADAPAEIRVEKAEVGLDGTRAALRLPSGPLEIELPLVGDFNVENMAVAVGVAVALEIGPDDIARGVSSCRQVPGRTERVGAGVENAPTILVDYAHTPDAVEKLLRTIRPLAAGRLITVFGCGGDRDRSKRPLMAKAVADCSDRAIATSDNPRTEDPLAILSDVEEGLGDLRRVDGSQLDRTERSYALVVDRREAIGLALGIARPEDIVVLAGKGHEDYQIIGRERLPFDDRVEALRALGRRSP
jgi:UDP-N-acetylmuramoyl-L-alanyl-D-glutamate--2,6-diaminopimelate ligase